MSGISTVQLNASLLMGPTVHRNRSFLPHWGWLILLAACFPLELLISCAERKWMMIWSVWQISLLSW